MLPIYREGQNQGVAYDHPSTEFIENMGSSAQKIYEKVLFPPKDDGVANKDSHLYTNGERAFPWGVGPI